MFPNTEQILGLPDMTAIADMMQKQNVDELVSTRENSDGAPAENIKEVMYISLVDSKTSYSKPLKIQLIVKLLRIFRKAEMVFISGQVYEAYLFCGEVILKEVCCHLVLYIRRNLIP